MYNYNQLPPEKCEFFEIAATDALPPGERLFVEIGDRSIVIFNIAGKLFAIGDICSHDEGPLGDADLDDYEIVCPRHGARFDIRTGEVTRLPAGTDIPAYPVRVLNNMIEVGIPKDD